MGGGGWREGEGDMRMRLRLRSTLPSRGRFQVEEVHGVRGRCGKASEGGKLRAYAVSEHDKHHQQSMAHLFGHIPQLCQPDIITQYRRK